MIQIQFQFSSPPEENRIHKPAHAYKTPANIHEYCHSAAGYKIQGPPTIISVFCEDTRTCGGKLDLISCLRHLLWLQVTVSKAV